MIIERDLMLILKITETLSTEEITLGVRRIPPVWGARLTAGEYFRIVSPGLGFGRDLLTPAEIGCTLSHLAAYAVIVKEGRPALILEDDMSLSVETLGRVQKLTSNNPNFLHLAEYSQFSFRGKNVGEGVWLIDPRRDFWGTAAYYISVKTAERLRDFHAPAIRKADDWANFFLNNEVSSLFSPIFFHSGENSRIEGERRIAHPISVRKLILRRFHQWKENNKIIKFILSFGFASVVPRSINANDGIK